MGKNKKGNNKKQDQQNKDRKNSNDIVDDAVETKQEDEVEQPEVLNEQDPIVEDVALIQPNSHQQKIIQEILKDDEDQQSNENNNVEQNKIVSSPTSNIQSNQDQSNNNVKDLLDFEDTPVQVLSDQQQQELKNQNNLLTPESSQTNNIQINNNVTDLINVDNVNQQENIINNQGNQINNHDQSSSQVVQTNNNLDSQTQYNNNNLNTNEQQDQSQNQQVVEQQTLQNEGQQQQQSLDQQQQPIQQEQQVLEEVRFRVNIFDQAKNGYVLPWAYAIKNEMISPLEYDKEGFHLIHRASFYNQLDVIHALVARHGVPVDLIEKNQQQTPLMIACLYGHLKLVKYLIQNGANVNMVDAQKFTPLTNSVMNRHIAQTVYLLSKGADPNVLDQDNCNLAHRAAFNNDVPMLQILNKIAPDQFYEQDKYKLAPVGRAITNDSHQAYEYLQRTKPIPVPNNDFKHLQNKCMMNLIKSEYRKQNSVFLSKEWLINCYKSKPKDICIFMYAIFVMTLYYHFVLQTGILYHKSQSHYYFCNVLHILTVFFMTYIFIFTLKVECPSLNLKLQSNHSSSNINFRKYNMSIVNFKYLDRLFGYNQTDVNTSSNEEIELEEQQQQQNRNNSIQSCKRSLNRMNVLDYIVILIENEKFSELKNLNDRRVCYECLDLKEDRSHHSDKFGFCVKNISHFSMIFDKLIIKGNNYDKYYFIISLQWVLLVLFFISNYLFCLAQYKFEGMTIFTFVEIPFIYYMNSHWKYLAIYLFACILFHVATIYFFLETYCLAQNITRFEVMHPNKCDYFYPSKNIEEFMTRSRVAQENSASGFYRYYENPYSNCKK